MNRLLEDKLSLTMKGALARNSAVESKMKASVDVMSSEQKKLLQNMEYYKDKYAKRQRELQNEKQRMLNSRSSEDEVGPRKISAPACMVTVVEYKDLSSGGFVTQVHPRTQSANPRTARSVSFPNEGTSGRLPSLRRSENGGRSPEPISEKNGGLTLPAIWANGNNQGRQRRLSASSLACPDSAGLLVPTMANTQARSAPSSPCMPRREMAKISSPAPRARSKSPRRELHSEPSLIENVREKLTAEMQQAMTNAKEFHLQRQQAIEVPEKEQAEPDVKTSPVSSKKVQDNPKTRKISNPGTAIPSSHSLEQATSGDEKSLEESINQIRFCQYLRSPSLPEDEEKLPDVLIPKAIIGGHTQWVPDE